MVEICAANRFSCNKWFYLRKQYKAENTDVHKPSHIVVSHLYKRFSLALLHLAIHLALSLTYLVRPQDAVS